MVAGGGIANLGGTAQHPCYANFPGTGAKQFPGMRCSNCEHILRIGVKKQYAVCVKAAQLVQYKMKKTWPRARHIDAQALACSYFERTTKALF